MTPRATFVIPAYNAARWVSKAIWSCRNQTIKQIEIIVVNDGSTDGTKDIIEWHVKEDARVVVYHQANAGRSVARNVGNDLAHSNLLLVLDADDMATRNRVKDTLAAFQLKKCDFLFGSFFVVDAHGNVEPKPVICPPFDPEVSKQKKMNFMCHSTVAYTKLVAETIRYESGMCSDLGLDDWRFQWDVHLKKFKIANIRNPLCYYRATEDGTMATRDKTLVDAAKEVFLATI